MKNKTVLITGAGRGIGAEMAQEFARAGYVVVINDLEETLESRELLGELKAVSPDSSAFYFDITDIKSVESNTKSILEKYKSVDILINNAGIVRDKTLVKMDYEDWDKVLKTHLYASFYMIKNILPGMMENNWGRVINISSIVGQMGNFGQTNYSSAKAGIIGLTKSLAKETARHKVTVNAICPGLVDTEMIRTIPKEYMDKMLEKIPLGRPAEKKEIAKLALFLASEDSSYITGAEIKINGGWL